MIWVDSRLAKCCVLQGKVRCSDVESKVRETAGSACLGLASGLPRVTVVKN